MFKGYFPVVLVVCVLLPILVVTPFVSAIPARQLDFELYDARLSKPVALVEHVPMDVVWYSGIVVSVLFIAAVDLYHPAWSSNNSAVRLTRITLSWMAFITAINVSFFSKEVLKRFIGKLRPDFLDRCQPDPELLAAPVQLLQKYNDTICTNPNKQQISDGRNAFPSGHSTVAGTASTFLALYATMSYYTNLGRSGRYSDRKHRLLLLYINLFLIAWAWYVAASAQVDNRHAAEDTIGGLIIGALIGLLFAHTCMSAVGELNAFVVTVEEQGHTELDSAMV